MSLPRVQARRRDRLGDQVEGSPVAVQVGGEAALVAEPGRQALLLQHRLERVVDLRALAQRLTEGRRPDGRDHELLDVHVGVGVRPAVEDVHHRHRQQVGVGATDVAEQREGRGLGGGVGDRERDSEDGVCAELGLVGRRVEVEHRLVEESLLVGFEALDRRCDGLEDALDGANRALAEVAVAAVAQFDGLECARGRAAGDRGPAERAVVEGDLDLDSWVSARVQDFARVDGFDGGHGHAPEEEDLPVGTSLTS